MRNSPPCLLLVLVYVSIAMDFQLVLVVDSTERPELYTPYYAQWFTVVVWGTLALSAGFFTLTYCTEPGYSHQLTRPDDLSAHRCKTCLTPKPPRSHHCSECGHCVLHMDHHCAFVANCVGLHNRKYFVLFLTYTVPGGLLYVYLLFQYSFGRVGGEKLQSVLPATAAKVAFCISAIAQAGLLFLVCLLGTLHWALVLQSSTSVEVIRDLSAQQPVILCCLPKEPEYDYGLIGNCVHVFGRALMQWGLPLPPVFAEERVEVPVGIMEPDKGYVAVVRSGVPGHKE